MRKSIIKALTDCSAILLLKDVDDCEKFRGPSTISEMWNCSKAEVAQMLREKENLS